MDPQREALPAWVTSLMDDCKLDGELDPATYYILQLYADRAWVANLVDQYNSLDRGPERFRFRRAEVAAQLRAEADRAWTAIEDKVVRRGIVFDAILDFCVMLRDTAHHYAIWAITDMCEGGCKENFRAPPRPGLREAWMPGKKVARRARSPRFIRNYISNMEGLADFRESGRRLLAFVNSEPGPYAFDARSDVRIADMLAAQVPSTLPEPEYRQELLRWLERTQGIKVRKIKKRIMRRRAMRERRRVARAANFAAGLIGPQAVNQFVQGRIVRLVGPDLTFGVQRRVADLAAAGHGCLGIGVKATQGNVPLGTICFYFEDTPMLDQLAALALHVQSGTEREILATANMVTVAPEGVDHPFLVERRSQELAREQERAYRNPIYRGSFHPGRNYDPRALRAQRNEMYWATTGNLWVSTLAVQVMGRDAPAFTMSASSMRIAA